MNQPISPATLVGPKLASGALRLTGRDVLAVLHNISTQSLLDLAPGEARLALLCDFRGRLLHRFAAARLADGSVWLVREDGGGTSLQGTIERAVFREDVKIEDLSATLGVAAEFGASARDSSIAAPERGAVLETNGHPTRIEIPGCPALVVADAPAAIADAARWNADRITNGWAAHGHEVSEAFTPFDVNLGLGVHLDKGCFTGQETLMRLVTYGNLRRRLVGVRGTGALPGAPALRDAAGAELGVLTSAAASGDGWSALAVVKQVSGDDARRAEALEGRELVLADGRVAKVERVFAFAQPAGRALREG